MYTIVFQKSPKSMTEVENAPDGDSLNAWLYDMARQYPRIVYLLIIDGVGKQLLRYKRTAH